MRTIKRNNKFYEKKLNELLKEKKDYKTPEVKEYLEKVYNKICCYCESDFSFSAYPEIEHFYPKNNSKSPKYSKYKCTIENLHYSCPVCNNKKSINTFWKELEWKPFFSPNYILNDKENKFIEPKYNVEDSFKYDLYNISPVWENKVIAENTINLFWLDWSKNRKSLITKRISVFDKALKISEQIDTILERKRIENCDTLNYLFEELSDMMNDNSPYSTMIKKQFWEIYIKLYEKLQQKKLD